MTDATLAALIAAARDPDPGERLWAAEHLATEMDDENPAGVAELLALSADPDVRVRDWATFSLSHLVHRDGPEVRAALWARVDDRDEAVRSYALHGLARRRDRRAWPLMLAAFESGVVKEHLFEAAGFLREPALAPHLREFDDEKGRIAAALTECDPALRAARDALVLRVADLLLARAAEFEPTLYCERFTLDILLETNVYRPHHVTDVVAVLRSVGDDPDRAAAKIIDDLRARTPYPRRV
ncbi:HEAT repeat domain-containing protein [Catenuloplanes atrovinosus]|uniref:HEAT repeat protein n=1 Tax=Catenuloplanes atrovinosus TaxID=137266 RepID=A0AAE3YRR1_9ACTN|nr:HEAT repeat domain-containing protein [Catenuloplanes atrovinosus]MDR7277427.1 HEAT repeat protein [Catenuloplanes atrovinosus]